MKNYKLAIVGATGVVGKTILKVLEEKHIATPNCSTIQAVVALKPLDDKYKIKRIVYSTYQAVSGAGSNAIQIVERLICKD